MQKRPSLIMSVPPQPIRIVLVQSTFKIYAAFASNVKQFSIFPLSYIYFFTLSRVIVSFTLVCIPFVLHEMFADPWQILLLSKHITENLAFKGHALELN